MNLSERQRVVFADPDAVQDVEPQGDLTIDAFFDFICPWCLVGKRNLETAVSLFAGMRSDIRVTVRWRSYQLLPHTPSDGLPYQAFIATVWGAPTPWRQGVRKCSGPDAMRVSRSHLIESRFCQIPSQRTSSLTLPPAISAKSNVRY